MKKRKAKRVKPSNYVDIEFEIAKTIDEDEKIKEEALINLIAELSLKRLWTNITTAISHLNSPLITDNQ